jgi:branched-chain amino acid transport system ATP-binding protein
MTEALATLVVDDLRLAFGGVQALSGVSFDVAPGEIAAIIGPNGAGKTSLLNAISGLYVPQHGRIQFEGQEIVGRKAHHVARLGIARTFQNLGLFPRMSVLDNLLLGRHHHMRAGIFSGALYWGFAQREEVRHRQEIATLLEMLQLQHVAEAPVGSLAYGLQKRVELARALVQLPKLLLLDEPMAGMHRREKLELARCILDVQRESNITVLMIEHDMGIVMDIAQHIVALDFGRVIGDGPPRAIRNNPAVVQAYLGQESPAAPGSAEKGAAHGLPGAI